MANQYQMIIAIKLWCPYCGVRHIDETRKGERWDLRAHTTHRCQGCSKDFDVYVSGAPDDAQPTLNVSSVGLSCGCPNDAHPPHLNKLGVGSSGKVCALGWPL